MLSLRHITTEAALFLDQRLERARVRFVCLSLLVLSLGLLVVSFGTAQRGRTIFGPALGADFANFYTGGTILNLPAPASDHLYDMALQGQVYHQVLPNARPEEINPFVHPPFVAFVFAQLARLPYEGALAVWLGLSLALYLGGFAITWRTSQGLPAQARRDVLLLVLAFEPFVMECWLGGQLSALGFFCMAAALALDQTQRPVLSGLVLGLCLYKPTLLVLVVPMLVVGCRFRTLAGMSVTGLGLAGFSLLVAGWRNCLTYAGTLLAFTRTAAGTGMQLKTWKYVDLNFFFRNLSGGPSSINWVLILALAAGPLLLLGSAWWRFDRLGATPRRLVWACTLTWTLVLNLYVGIYDSILVVLGALLTGDVLGRLRKDEAEETLPRTFRLLLAALFLAPWISQPLAQGTGFQVYTVALVALGIYQFSVNQFSVFRVQISEQKGSSPG